MHHCLHYFTAEKKNKLGTSDIKGSAEQQRDVGMFDRHISEAQEVAEQTALCAQSGQPLKCCLEECCPS